MQPAFSTVAENGNAGDLVTGPAQDLTGQAVTQIDGAIGNTISDADCYRITITAPAGFSVDVASFGGNGDSQLFLFDRSGQAIWSNDDRGDGG